MTKPAWLTKQFQWIAILPFLIFVYRLIQYISVGTPDWIMYNCHVTTLMLCIAMFVGSPLFIRIAVIWLVIGLPMWLIDAWVIREIWFASVISHLGGFLLAIYAIKRVRATGRAWLPAWGWFLCWQLVTRYTTEPKLNVNVAHSPYAGCDKWFDSYWAFWPLGALVVGLMVGIVEFILARLYTLNTMQEMPAETVSMQGA